MYSSHMYMADWEGLPSRAQAVVRVWAPALPGTPCVVMALRLMLS
jgi:hypothetical protein